MPATLPVTLAPDTITRASRVLSWVCLAVVLIAGLLVAGRPSVSGAASPLPPAVIPSGAACTDDRPIRLALTATLDTSTYSYRVIETGQRGTIYSSGFAVLDVPACN